MAVTVTARVAFIHAGKASHALTYILVVPVVVIVLIAALKVTDAEVNVVNGDVVVTV